jgi:predicted TIM-barrel fold metal-dependent hydrolase
VVADRGRFAGVLRAFPDLRCVIARPGCFEAERFRRAALDHEHLHLDTADTFIDNPTNRMDAPVHLLEAAAHKVLFTTDFPGICHPYTDPVRGIAELPLSRPAMEAIFHGNARRLLDPSTG